MLKEQKERGFCIICKNNKQNTNGKSKLGFTKYILYCAACEKRKYKKKDIQYTYRDKKGSICNRCGFSGEKCQLDVHHKDGNHKNDVESNLETVCSNCHRLEHFSEKKYKKKKDRII